MDGWMDGWVGRRCVGVGVCVSDYNTPILVLWTFISLTNLLLITVKNKK